MASIPHTSVSSVNSDSVDLVGKMVDHMVNSVDKMVNLVDQMLNSVEKMVDSVDLVVKIIQSVATHKLVPVPVLGAPILA